MRKRLLATVWWIAGCAVLGLPSAAAQDAAPVAVPVAGPADAYQGCEGVTLPAAASSANGAGSSSDRVRQTQGVQTEIKTETRTRILQGQPLEIAEADGDDTANDNCWARLDGVWREDRVIVLDPSIDPSGWAAEVPSLKGLAHGTYTAPRLLVAARTDNMDREIVIHDGFNPADKATFVSDDGIALSDVLKRGGKRKTYAAKGKNPFGEKLDVDVSRSGFVRLRIDGKLFMRPSPGITNAARQEQYDMDDVFLVGYNLVNMIASRKGYDITKQDPFRILRNDRAEIFQEVYGKDYRILEQRTVPLGFHLIQEVEQGMLYTRTSSRTEREIQDQLKWSYGGRIRVGNELVTSGSVAVDFVKETSTTMRDSQMASQAIGYSRSKQYALVVDHPYIQLHPNFIDAVEDARRYGDADPSMYTRIIDTFGTHYPYAVTYGANGKMTLTYSEKETNRQKSTFESARGEAELDSIKGAVSGYVERQKTDSSSSTWGSSDEKATFEAVGGNGSWDEKGYAAGQTPYPILLDLRPIDELLNPMNFPGEPGVYEKVRKKLAGKIEDYLTLRAAGISDWPIVDTTLNGHYVSDAFPGMLLTFNRKDFTNSELVVTGMDGRSFSELMRDRIKEGSYKQLPDIVKIWGQDYAKHYDREEHKFHVGFTLTRKESEGYGYSKNLMSLMGAEKYAAIEKGVIDPEWFDLATLLGAINRKSVWYPQLDGSLHLKVYPDAKPIKLQRLSSEQVAKQKRPALTGYFTAKEWPAYYFSFEETAWGSTVGTVYDLNDRYFLAPDQAEIDRLTASGISREDIKKKYETPDVFELVRLDADLTNYRYGRKAERIMKLVERNAAPQRDADAITFGGRIPVETATWHYDGHNKVTLKFNDEAGTEIALIRDGAVTSTDDDQPMVFWQAGQ